MTNSSPLPLYRVLIDEYNQQRVGPPFSEEDVAKKLREANELFADIEDKEERSKKINSAMTAEFYKWLHTHKVRRTALCFSGGGIRSATFGLGILQGLARFNLIEKFDYLSTVSGGGYLGSWLSAWIHRRGLGRVQEGLKNSPPKSPLQPEPEPVKHLRSYSNYMSPKPGLTSADTWTLVAIFFRNLLLNWLVLIPLILAVLMVPRLSGALVALAPDHSIAKPIFLFAVLLGIFAIGYIYANRPSLADPPSEGSRYPSRRKSQGWFLVFCLVPLVALAVLITSYYAWLPLDITAYEYNVLEFFSLHVVIGFIVFGALLHLGGLVVSLWWVRWLRWPEYVTALLSGGLGGLLTWLLAANVFPHPGPSTTPPVDLTTTALYVCFGAPLFLLLFLIAVTIFVGLASYYTTDADREWLARAGGWVL
ncbi:MAG TPA: patatin-like phospholipase family protein, partial [Pyrinomonadaceae bacterium]|nr:patatin-like phospholipase family protein [Pyrinomonadaceae bacterium]